MPSLKRRFRSRVSPPGRRPPRASPSPRPSGFDRFTPSPDTLERFLSDPDPLAYERMVDQLLASEHYGERMAMEWLDVARFADTYGYQSDRFNHLWPWRDWVIAAFNDNLSYDTFILHQMAGDLIDQPTQQSILATAFHRNHRQTNEGGSVNEEFRVEYNADRLKTTALAFMGLTIECARCHDHKYDPISQKDYYRLFAFFNNTDESGLYSHFTDAIPSPRAFFIRTRVRKQSTAAPWANPDPGGRGIDASRKRTGTIRPLAPEHDGEGRLHPSTQQRPGGPL